MLRSMTGYGRAEVTIGEKLLMVEIRSLNGKQIDLLLKVPSPVKPFEFEIRNIINEQLSRGSIECTITIKLNGSAKPSSINLDLVKSYFHQLKSLANELHTDDQQLLASILRLPDVVAASTDVISPSEWEALQKVIQEAINMLNKHRTDEGAALEKELLLRISNIEALQQKVLELDPARKVKIRENLLKLLQENVSKESGVDMNRFEQELIYYIEKIDLTEEQVRLSNHCQYFRSLLAEKELSKGRKLSFLLQEIGREINTTGSKAYDANIQKSVVEMKDELEKAKEQVLNVL
ncbi:MAG: YicC family protein [Chitinophagia bacterium]|nr:YicC family protein [Chitinophagia bacterium]